MQARESTTQKHTRLAYKFLEDAEREIAAGDYPQAAEKLWGATSQALKAYCASRSLPHSKYAQRRRAAMDLAAEQDSPFIRVAFNLARACHSNFYNDWLEQEDLDNHLPDIRKLVEIVLSAKEAPASC